MNPSIVPLDPSGLPAVLKLWRGYQEFYQVTDIDESRNREHVEQILANPALGRIHLAVTHDGPIARAGVQ